MLAPHFLPCAKICGAVASLSTAWIRLKEQVNGLADPDSGPSRDALASGEEIEKQDDNGQNEQEMNEAMYRHARHHPHQPKGEENYHNRVQHIKYLFLCY
jgi:hypothetical protein